MKTFKKFFKTDFFYILIIFLFSFWGIKSLIRPETWVAHDILCHIDRLASFYQSLEQGNIIPRWGGNLNAGYGHPSLMFLYPATNYFGVPFHLLSISFTNSIKLLFIISYFLSGIFMYFWIKDLWGKGAGLASSILYLFAPYRFVNIYVRAALGEHLAMIFIPSTCWLIYRLAKTSEKKYLVLGSLSLAFLILSHNAVSVMMMPFVFMYGTYLILNNKKKKLVTCYLLLVTIFGFGLSAFFWLPAFFEGKYTLRNITTTPEIFANRYLNFWELINSTWNYGEAGWKGKPYTFSVQVGWALWLTYIISLIFLLNDFFKKKKERILAIGLVFYFAIACFLMVRESAFLLPYVPLIYRFQFPFRLLIIPIFSGSVLVGQVVGNLKRKELRNSAIVIFILIAVLNTSGNWQPKEWFGENMDLSDEFFLREHVGTTDTGESTPIWTVRFQEKIPPAKLQVVSGQASFEIKKWFYEEHQYQVFAKVDSQIADNTLYFPGWRVYIDGEKAPIEFQDQNWRGIITYPVSKGIHQVRVVFGETKLRLVADLISGISLIMILVISLLDYGVIPNLFRNSTVNFQILIFNFH